MTMSSLHSQEWAEVIIPEKGRLWRSYCCNPRRNVG